VPGGEQRVVTGVLGMMRIKATCGPGDFVAGANHGAVKVDPQTPQFEVLDLLIEQSLLILANAPSEARVNCLSQLTTVRSLGIRDRPQNRANNESWSGNASAGADAPTTTNPITSKTK
jgi:hypothetical protein